MRFLVPSVRWVRGLLIAGGLASIAPACGGRSDTEDYLFGSDGTINQGASASIGGKGAGGTRTGVAGAVGTGADGGSGVGATGSFGGTGVVTGGSSTVGGSIGIAGDVSTGGSVGVGGTISVGGSIGVGGTGVGGAVTAGAGGMPAVTPITCGASTCDANKQICCAGFGGFTCIGKNKACNGATLGCTTNADCEGNGICCISITGDADAASSCKDRCNNMGTGRDRQLCEVDTDCQMPFRFCTPTVFGVNICTRRP